MSNSDTTSMVGNSVQQILDVLTVLPDPLLTVAGVFGVILLLIVFLCLGKKTIFFIVAVVALLLLATGGIAAALYANSLKTNVIQPLLNGAVFVQLDNTIKLDPFVIVPKDIDTLHAPKYDKWKKRDQGEQTANHENERSRNVQTYGADGIKRFLAAGRNRLENEYFIHEYNIDDVWPTLEKYSQASGAELMQMLKGMDLVVIKHQRLESEKKPTVRDAFSKWALVSFEISEEGQTPTLTGYYPKGNRIKFEDGQGTTYELEIVDIFNGDRSIGETEGCIFRMHRLDKRDR